MQYIIYIPAEFMSNFNNNLSTYLLSNHYSEKNRIKIFKSTHIFKYSKYFKWIILFSPKMLFSQKSQGQISRFFFPMLYIAGIYLIILQRNIEGNYHLLLSYAYFNR